MIYQYFDGLGVVFLDALYIYLILVIFKEIYKEISWIDILIDFLKTKHTRLSRNIELNDEKFIGLPLHTDVLEIINYRGTLNPIQTFMASWRI